MILYNVDIVGEDEIQHIQINNGKIQAVVSDVLKIKPAANELRIDVKNAMAFPGLINSHDHLEFNLFPALGNKIYNNYVEWGNDIHAQNKTEIEAVLKIPKNLRIQWGMYKNLLGGVTTVVHHGPLIEVKAPVIDVFQNCYSLHSVQLQKRWKLILNNPLHKGRPYVIHVGEGTDVTSSKEIDELLHYNFLKKQLIGIHAVAINSRQAKQFQALIWCPVSNYFLLNKTAKVNELKKETSVIFGTDSTITANWNIWDHLRFARKLKLVTDEHLVNMLTTVPSKIWKLNNGKIKEHYDASIVIAKKQTGTKKTETFFSLNPHDLLLIINRGEIIFFDQTFHAQLAPEIEQKTFSKIYINGCEKYIRGNLPALIEKIHTYNPDAHFPISF